jgi:hypothetical protein
MRTSLVIRLSFLALVLVALVGATVEVARGRRPALLG